jgi:hypothetical protein
MVHETVGWTAFVLGFLLVLAGHLAFRRLGLPTTLKVTGGVNA